MWPSPQDEIKNSDIAVEMFLDARKSAVTL
jgi:hypothetical protein